MLKHAIQVLADVTDIVNSIQWGYRLDCGACEQSEYAIREEEWRRRRKHKQKRKHSSRSFGSINDYITSDSSQDSGTAASLTDGAEGPAVMLVMIVSLITMHGASIVFEVVGYWMLFLAITDQTILPQCLEFLRRALP
ncbi:hypothetical protein BU17DRAFT_87148 [Hysterangium stoloniferum]|nr:hypothetical protein BU17DRAFT_87148 [Hysterangium stoloniferum]